MEEYCYYATCGLFPAKRNIMDTPSRITNRYRNRPRRRGTQPMAKQKPNTNPGEPSPSSPSSDCHAHELRKMHEIAINSKPSPCTAKSNHRESEMGQPFMDHDRIYQVKHTYGKHGKYTQYICTTYTPYNEHEDTNSHTDSRCAANIHACKSPASLHSLPSLLQKRSLDVTPEPKSAKVRRIEIPETLVTETNLFDFVNHHQWDEARTEHLERQLTQQIHELTVDRLQVDNIDSVIDIEDERIVTPLQLKSEENSAVLDDGSEDEDRPSNLFRYRAKRSWNRKSLDLQERELLKALRDGVEED